MFSLIHNWVLDLILPRHCLGCGVSKTDLCPACLSGLPSATPPEQQKDRWSLFDYHHPLIKSAIWHLKYRGRRALGQRLGQELHERLIKNWQILKPVLVVPVPLARARLAERGFNQSALIARGLVQSNPDYLKLNERCLIKIKTTPTQVEIKNREERLINLRGAFAVRAPEEVRGQTIILVDDVLTTGGTVTEARRVLLDAGAARVIITTIAHG
ncbi:MAG: ComF family protein [Patescibacteria group bacterium]